MRQRYLLAACFATGFALTAGISLWRAHDSDATPVRTSSAAAAPIPPGPSHLAPRPADVKPLTGYAPDPAAAADQTVDSPEQRGAVRRALARRSAAERNGH